MTQALQTLSGAELAPDTAPVLTVQGLTVSVRTEAGLRPLQKLDE